MTENREATADEVADAFHKTIRGVLEDPSTFGVLDKITDAFLEATRGRSAMERATILGLAAVFLEEETALKAATGGKGEYLGCLDLVRLALDASIVHGRSGSHKRAVGR